jgi:hypothetical protein
VGVRYYLCLFLRKPPREFSHPSCWACRWASPCNEQGLLASCVVVFLQVEAKSSVCLYQFPSTVAFPKRRSCLSCQNIHQCRKVFYFFDAACHAGREAFSFNQWSHFLSTLIVWKNILETAVPTIHPSQVLLISDWTMIHKGSKSYKTWEPIWYICLWQHFRKTNISMHGVRVSGRDTRWISKQIQRIVQELVLLPHVFNCLNSSRY